MDILLILATMILALISPGPDFVFILRQNIKYGKRAGIISSLGLSLGVAMHVSLSAFGLGYLLFKMPFLFQSIKILGGIYFLYLSYKSFISHGFYILDKESKKLYLQDAKAFIQGLFCNLFNPKAALFFISLFSIFIKENTSFKILIFYVFFAIFSTFLWFSFLSCVLSKEKIQAFFNKYSLIFDKILAFLFLFLAFKIILS